MSRLLGIVRRVYGDDTCRLIFEPLVADALGDRRSVASRARWYAAVASTFVMCLPRATFGRLSRGFVLDLAGRAIAFFALAFALQWSIGARVEPQSGAPTWPPAFATTFFFMLTPVIWRLRREAIPIHQQRLLTVAGSALCVGAAWLSASPGPAMGEALLIGTAWLSYSSWRLFDGIIRNDGYASQAFVFVYPALAIVIASVPVKLALGISLWRPWWPGDNFIPYVVGAVIALSSDLPTGEAGYRKLFPDPVSIFPAPAPSASSPPGPADADDRQSRA